MIEKAVGRFISSPLEMVGKEETQNWYLVGSSWLLLITSADQGQAPHSYSTCPTRYSSASSSVFSGLPPLPSLWRVNTQNSSSYSVWIHGAGGQVGRKPERTHFWIAFKKPRSQKNQVYGKMRWKIGDV